MNKDEIEIRSVLDAWAEATREGRQDDILKNHLPDLVVFDVLPPLRYESAADYRASWDEWQPESTGETLFHLEDLTIAAGADVAFAFGILQCGGAAPDGKTFRDTVRATFCMQKIESRWMVAHQHISKPLGRT